MATGLINSWKLNSSRLNNGTDRVPYSFFSEMRRKRDSTPFVRVEFVEVDGTAHDITRYYDEGATFEQVKERAPDEIQAGNFDLVLFNEGNKFSEYISGSLLDGIQYHGATLKVYIGFRLPDGTEVYEQQTEGIIDQLVVSNDQKATFRCRDRISFILDTTFHKRPTEENPIYDAGNLGNGARSSVETLPFAVIDQDWTLTCTTGGPSGTAEFSVVGSVSGNIGTATVGTEFQDDTAGIRFTINPGTIDWAVGDIITFSTRAYPQWEFVNPAKIIWSLLTGFNYDTDTEEGWSDFVLGLDSTQSDANTDIDWESFQQAVTDLEAIDPLKGYVPYNQPAKQFLEDLLILFLGSLYTGLDGRLKLKANIPALGVVNATAFKDEEQISSLSYARSIDEIINHVVGRFKAFDDWEYSDQSIILGGIVVEIDQTSIDTYRKTITKEIASIWYTVNGTHVQTVAQRLINKYANPPLNIDFTTGLDAVRSEIGDVVEISDVKYGFAALRSEISRVTKLFDEEPMKVSLRVRKDADFEQLFGFWGSTADEGDGESPQDTNWDTATDTDKQFAYLSQTGGGGPDYRMY